MKEGWEYKKLKEVGLTQTGTTPSKQIKAYYGGDIPFIRPAELNVDQNGGVQYDSELKLTEEGALKSRVIKANSVLMCCIGSVGKTGYTLNNVTCNQQINTLTPYDNYNPRFVYYALISPFFQQEVINIANSAKATLPIISKGKWEILSIPVPPLSEQQSIVDYLDSAFAKIDAMKANAEKALNEAKALFQASLKEMLEPKEGWEYKELGKVCDIVGGGTPDTKNKEYWRGNIPWATVSDMNCDIIKSTGYYITEKGLNESSSRIIKKGEIIIATRVGLGKVCKLAVDTAINQDLKGVIPKDNSILRDFIFYYFKHKAKYIVDNGIGATVKGVKIKFIEGLSFAFPSLSEQQSIVATLDSLKSKVDRLQENYEKISQECDALKQSILRQVFDYNNYFS